MSAGVFNKYHVYHHHYDNDAQYLLVSRFLRCSARFMAEQRRKLKMTKRMQGKRWTKNTRNQKNILQPEDKFWTNTL